MIAWSCGGGLQSVAIGVLIRSGILRRPDLAGIADTSREVASTWSYLEDVLNPYLAPAGVHIEVIPHEQFTRRDLYSPNGDMLMPAYTSRGRLATFCSGEWKRDAFERWLRSKGVKGEIDCWIGFSLDEMGRVKKDHRPWCHYKYPLLDLRLSRAACAVIIEKAGLPMPHKSRCWCCPHQNAEEWAEIKNNPEEWEKAVQLDQEIREADVEKALFLHSSRVPLPLADLTVDEAMPLFRHCQDGGCWT